MYVVSILRQMGIYIKQIGSVGITLKKINTYNVFIKSIKV